MVLTVDRTSQSRSLTPTQIAMNEPKGRGLKAWNPYYKPNGGVIATVRIPGNGTGTFTLDSTVYGRNILWPLACRVGKEQTGLFTDQTFTSVTRDVNNNFVCVLSNSAVAYTDQDIYVDVITDMPVLVFNNQTNGVSKQVVGRMLRVKVLESATRIVFRAPGEIMGLVDYQACLPIASNGVSVPLSTSVIPDAPVGPTIALTFPSPVAAGTILEVAVVTRQEFYPSSGLALSYAVGTMSKLNEALLDPSEPVTVLCDPVLIAHTKGTGGADTNPDWGSTPFVRDSQLTSAFIALINQTPVKAVIYDIHKSKNRFGSSPLLAGRKVLISELFNNISFKQSTLVEGQPLSTPVPHAMVLATLVSYKGRRLLLVCSEKRVDEKTAIGGAATFSLYEPNGRPLAVQEA